MPKPSSESTTSGLELWEAARALERQKRDRRLKRERLHGVVGSRRSPVTKEWFEAVIETDPISGCWCWMRFRDTEGYGRLSYLGHPMLAHRVAWLLWSGEFDRRLFVCHKCDNPPCVNPEHLFLGTARDNTDDRISKGRWKPSGVMGERHGMAKLTETKARAIFFMPGKQRDIAILFGVSQHTVWQIKTGKLWKHIHNATA